MLKITIPSTEMYDPEENVFHYTKEQTLTLEHSLVSISKWESKWRTPFFSKAPKTNKQIADYVRCMTLTQNVNPEVYECISSSDLDVILKYIDEPMTATWFSDDNKKKSREIITSEIIYYWMIALNIPFECQKWHLNRLLTLIRVCSEKNAPPKKMSKKELLSRNRALNAARRKAHKSKG